MNKPKVLVTRKWPAAIEEKLSKLYDIKLNKQDTPLSAQELKAALQNYDAILATVTDRFTAEVLSVADRRTKIIANFGVGYDNIDIQAAKQCNLIVTNTPEVLTECTADLTMMLLLMSARRAAEGERLIRSRQWHGWSPTHLLGQKVSGKTLGLIGFGRIAQAVARRAHHGFGMQILFSDPFVPAQDIVEELQAQRCDTIDELLTEAHFVSLHCPGGKATRHLINERRLKLMRPTAHLINTARGDVVDSRALIKALQQQWIAGAGLDVYEGEPNIDQDLLALENVTLLPHLGSATEETRLAMGNRVLDNVTAFFAGQNPVDRVA